MGVPGLSTYILENANSFLVPYELHNSYLVVDGLCVASHLYRLATKSHSAFGGDYDEYYKVVKDFFVGLKKCKVTSIVMFDGGYENKKIKTVLSRCIGSYPIIRSFSRGFSTSKYFCLYFKETFCDVMKDLEIFCLQCDFEADSEIAAVARALNCPVLSYDSDFFIYNVLYIPFTTACLYPVKFENCSNFYISCSLYNVKHFVNQFPGLDESMMPLLATLLGNDYTENSIFQNFFHHVSISKAKYKSFTQNKIHGLLHWLKKESVESATELILSHIKNVNGPKVLKAIKNNIRDYSSNFVSEHVMNQLTKKFGKLDLRKKPFKIDLPSEVLQLFHQCKVNKCIINIVNLAVYFTSLLVEDLNSLSCHYQSLDLIKSIYMLLTPYMKNNSKPLKVYLNMKNHYKAVQIERDPNSFLNFVFLHDILKESQEERLKWLCSIVGIMDEDLHIFSSSQWSVFLMAFLYWIGKYNNCITLSHIHSLVLMAISNQIVQQSVGYFRNSSKFRKSKGDLIDSLIKSPLPVGESTDFDNMLSDVTLLEKILVQGDLVQYRLTDENRMKDNYCISTVHLFGCFQSSLYYIIQINALLNYPLPHLRVFEFYSGTLLFNFYLNIKSSPQVEAFGCRLLKKAPNLLRIYKFLYEYFCKFSHATINCAKKHKNKRNKSKKRNYHDENSQPLNIVSDEEDEYDDECNPYSVLQKMSLN